MEEGIDNHFNKTHLMTTIAIIAAFAVQLLFNSLPAGAFAALVIMLVTGATKWRDMDGCFDEGLKLMGFLSFIVLVASGYGAVMKQNLLSS